MYGLKQSAHCWNLRINKVLINSGFRRGEAEACVYVKDNGDSITYVDDIVIASKDDVEINDIIKTLKSQFEITDLGNLKLNLGIGIIQENGMFYLSQRKSIEKILNDYNLKDAKVSTIPMEPRLFEGKF